MKDKIFWIALIGFVWLLQTYFGMKQVKKFNTELQDLYRKGKVVIGKYKGSFYKGCIVVFLIDKNNRIECGKVMEGVTVFAPIKDFNNLNGLNLEEVKEVVEHLGFNHSRIKAIKSIFKDIRRSVWIK